MTLPPLRRVVLCVVGASVFACTNDKSGKGIESAAKVGKAVVDETRYAREGRPRSFLAEGATAECSPFGEFVASCPLVPTCANARNAHEPLTLNVCTNERGALVRIVPCGSARYQNEDRCTSVSFLPCERLVGTSCTSELAVCDLGQFELAVARCCVDRAQCTMDTFVLMPRRSAPPR